MKFMAYFSTKARQNDKMANLRTMEDRENTLLHVLSQDCRNFHNNFRRFSHNLAPKLHPLEFKTIRVTSQFALVVLDCLLTRARAMHLIQVFALEKLARI